MASFFKFAAAGLCLLPLAAKIGLGVFGFSTIGPVAGSAAAGIQAGIGCVAAGSLFVAMQSITMGGTLTTLAIIGGIIGAIVTLIWVFS